MQFKTLFLNSLLLSIALVPRLAWSQAPPAQLEKPKVGSLRPASAFPFRDGDRVQWIGSSSTHFGFWPHTVEFLLRTRQPQLKLNFQISSTGGGTFATGLENFDNWTRDFKPTLIVLNYGVNDAVAGEAGLPLLKTEMAQLIAKGQALGARVLLTSPQAGDARQSSLLETGQRKLYAETMLAEGDQKGWPVVDVFHPLEALQVAEQAVDPTYTINSDHIHLTPAAYIAWGYFLYDALNAPPTESWAALMAAGTITHTQGCKISEVKVENEGLSFTRADAVLPILPPVPEQKPYPPRQYVPLERLSRYMLQVTGLAEGHYEILGEGKSIGATDAKALAAGVNLNSLLLDSGHVAPWDGLAREVWAGKSLDKIGHTAWRFTIRRLAL